MVSGQKREVKPSGIRKVHKGLSCWVVNLWGYRHKLQSMYISKIKPAVNQVTVLQRSWKQKTLKALLFSRHKTYKS